MKYGTILADPPWYEHGCGRSMRGADKHYAIMTTRQIKSMGPWVRDELAAISSHLYLWVTNNHMEDGMAVMAAWGFKFITVITWVKMVKFSELLPDLKTLYKLQYPGLGQYFRGVTEHCLFGRRGPVVLPQHKGKTVILAPRRAHSEKPAQVYTLAEMVSPAPRIELFARRNRPGWHTWGDWAPLDKKEVSHD